MTIIPEFPLTPRDRRSAAPFGEIGLPTKCQLGRIAYVEGFCTNESVIVIGNVRVCQEHLNRALAIAADADPEFVARHPVASGFLRTAP